MKAFVMFIYVSNETSKYALFPTIYLRENVWKITKIYFHEIYVLYFLNSLRFLNQMF